jgi:IS605 OrfB family transposase
MGTKKMFMSQFHLEENGYQNHAQWKEDWYKKRHNRIFYIGSKDESYGNQNCQLIKDILKIRVIPKLESIYGAYYNIAHIFFSYGQDIISKALEKHQAIHYRFVRKDKAWYLFLTTERESAKIATKKGIGAIGIDLNASHIAWTEVNRHGNPVDFGTILTPIQDCSCEQSKSMLSEALKQIVRHAKQTGKPIVIEDLDFSKKKSDLSDRSKQYKRMISGFAYSLFFNLLLSKASREGVEIISKNPAYSSVVGRYKYMQHYGISVHLAASLVLARRGLRCSERPPANYTPYLAEHKYGHVWSFWRKFSQAVSNREIQVDLTTSVRSKVSASSPLIRNTNSLRGIDCPLTCILTRDS